MSQDSNELRPNCPGCGEVLEPAWKVCPQCGLRLKPADDMFIRALFWTATFFVFVSTYISFMRTNLDTANTFAVVVGLPLAYVFGKAVIFRVRGTPLTWRQLRRSSFRTGVVVFFLLVVVPIVIGIALLLLLFAICGVSIIGGGMGSSH